LDLDNVFELMSCECRLLIRSHHTTHYSRQLDSFLYESAILQQSCALLVIAVMLSCQHEGDDEQRLRWLARLARVDARCHALLTRHYRQLAITNRRVERLDDSQRYEFLNVVSQPSSSSVSNAYLGAR
jgi:hypothetical protein